jgi:hypothetical protein
MSRFFTSLTAVTDRQKESREEGTELFTWWFTLLFSYCFSRGTKRARRGRCTRDCIMVGLRGRGGGVGCTA